MKRQLRPSYCIYLDKAYNFWCLEFWEKEECIQESFHIEYEEAYRYMQLFYINRVYETTPRKKRRA